MNNSKNLSHYKAWILDFDGTLCYQLPIRICMALMLIIYYAFHPFRVSEIFLILDYRRLREELFAADDEDFNHKQLSKLADKYNMSVENIEHLFYFWMEEKPLRLIKMFQRKKLIKSIHHYQNQGVRMIVYSDNPVNKKISVVDFVPDYAFYSDDELIKCMKPKSAGLKNILKLLHLKADEVLFIGDRDDRDGLCAEEAGVDYLNVKYF